MSKKLYELYIKDVPDFPKPGILFKDICPVLENAEAFKELIDDMSKSVEHLDFNKIVCADARGFIFGAAMAYKMNKGLVIARKPGKLSRPGVSFSYDLEYGHNTMVISEGSVVKGDKCLVVDDLLATGGSCLAMLNMVKECGAENVATVFFIKLLELHGDDAILEHYDLPVISMVNC